MHIDGSQFITARKIAKYIRSYMRYYDINVFVDPFCGFANIYRELYKNEKLVDLRTQYFLSDYNPFILAILNRIWEGKTIPDTLDRERWKAITKELKRRYKEDENIFAHYDGFEDWEVGCYLILGCHHQNPIKGYVGDDVYKKTANDLLKTLHQVPRPHELICCDYMDFDYFNSRVRMMMYFDFPEPSRQNFFPFGMFFERDEFFDFTSNWDNTDSIMIFSSKYLPDNNKYEVIYESKGHYLYIGKRWYVEDILDVANGTYRKYTRPARSISEQTRRGKRGKVPRGGGGRGLLWLEEETKLL